MPLLSSINLQSAQHGCISLGPGRQKRAALKQQERLRYAVQQHHHTTHVITVDTQQDIQRTGNVPGKMPLLGVHLDVYQLVALRLAQVAVVSQLHC
ncbi:hypothetical protein D3C72_1973890 [compost metagenome]